MPRKIRIVIPNIPHHIVQRGSRKDHLFFEDRDRYLYKEILAHYAKKHGVRISSYCLMTNHIHLIATPQDELALSKAIGIAHKVYSTIINQKMNLSGHLWEGRFKSYPMNKAHLIQAARYIERNPVTAGMVTDPALYQWSSCRHHLGLCHDFLVDPACKLTEYIEEDWKSFIQQPCRKEFDLKIGYFINKGDLAGPLPKNDPGTTPDHPG